MNRIFQFNDRYHTENLIVYLFIRVVPKRHKVHLGNKH